MNDNGESTGTNAGEGSRLVGFLQSLGVYLLGLAVFVVVVARPTRPPGGDGKLFEVVAVASVAMSAGVAIVQGRRGRVKTAAGAVAGTLLWPMIMLGLLAWAISRALSHATIPF